ncbi:uncharacterized protein TRIADDRAFT_62077 [Trichoplax adhaerens]|uniref:UDP-glucuronosyltransferase n=1 Tax=Trichoplax adhaerens TaxID=10228 RepID=B3SCS2_TRIAD|nr:hypothetical protein TRIADDRAFT_62077 [Trichoplax adhaerens]EDV19438.1 hypothetical protein TRIADDRAFT_62077 [Trichoplax adhaerens]|eukprot:XP_002118038.1 hypothetical protein TRIADDRAFT_62077 [Trichoplax adhaerens]
MVVGLWLVMNAIACVQLSSAAKIAIGASFYHSHTQVLAAIGEELHKRGHSVTVITSTANHFVAGRGYNILFYETPVTQHDIGSCTAVALKKNDVFITTCMKHLIDDNKAYMNDDSLLQQIRAEKFDAIVCDIACYPCHVVSEAAEIPIQIDVSTLGFVDPFVSIPFHIPAPLAYLPRMGLVATNKMNLYQRTINVVISPLIMTFLDNFIFDSLYKVVNKSKLGLQAVPKFIDTRATFLIVNGDFAIDYPRPLTPTSKMVGPVLPKPPKSLPPHLEEFITSNPNGTIVVSFGTVVTAVKYVIDIQVLFMAFSLLPYNVIWKYTEEVPKQLLTSNIKIVKWLPQNDLLGHANVKAFVTHCGLNSILEGAYHGKPMLGMPVVGDQIAHAQKIIAKGVGVVLDIKSATVKEIHNSIVKITTDKQILDNAAQVSKLIKNRPNGRTPVEEAGDWVEFALNCDGGNYLRTEEYNLSWYQLYLLDVYAVIAIMLFIFVKLLNLVWMGFAWLCCRKGNKLKES